MRRILKIIIIVIIVLFVIIQFFQPERNTGEMTSAHIFQNEKIPEGVMNTLKNACMDCHSNQTRYWWYDKLAPVSWMVREHITKGKKEINFSEWGKQDTYDKFVSFEDISKEVGRHTMPLKSYTMMHKKARLTDEERKTLVDWCKKRTTELTEELKK